MTKETAMFNQIWLWLNDLEAEFELFCFINDLDSNHPMSLQVFKSSHDEVVEKEKMTSSFSNIDGFFVCWNGGNSHLFNQTKELAQAFFDMIPEEKPVMYERRHGELRKIAGGGVC